HPHDEIVGRTSARLLRRPRPPIEDAGRPSAVSCGRLRPASMLPLAGRNAVVLRHSLKEGGRDTRPSPPTRKRASPGRAARRGEHRRSWAEDRRLGGVVAPLVRGIDAAWLSRQGLRGMFASNSDYAFPSFVNLYGRRRASGFL